MVSRWGTGHFDEFQNFGAVNPGTGGTTGGTNSGYGYYIDTASAAGSILQVASVGGIIRLLTSTQDNHETWLTTGGNTVCSERFASRATLRRLQFSRLAFGSIRSTIYSMLLLVFGEEALAAADTISDAGGLGK